MRPCGLEVAHAGRPVASTAMVYPRRRNRRCPASRRSPWERCAGQAFAAAAPARKVCWSIAAITNAPIQSLSARIAGRTMSACPIWSHISSARNAATAAPMLDRTLIGVSVLSQGGSPGQFGASKSTPISNSARCKRFVHRYEDDQGDNDTSRYSHARLFVKIDSRRARLQRRVDRVADISAHAQ